MTNFIYNMQDELFDLNMILPVGKFSPIKKLVDHIEAQGKQLRELNAAITKRNATIEKYEYKNKDLRERNALLLKKVDELNEGIRDSEDLTWKQKYDALLQSSEQAIGALQKKCQEYKNSESDVITNTIETLVKENNELKEENKALKEVRRPWGDNAEIISAKTVRIKELEDYISELENEVAGLKKELAFWKTDDKRSFFGKSFDMHSIYDLNRLEEVIVDKIKSYDSKIYSLTAERDKYKESSEMYRLKLMAAKSNISTIKNLKEDLEMEKQISKNKLLDEYMTKCNNLEHNYNEEVRMKEELKSICFRHERTIASQNSTIKYLKGKVSEFNNTISVLRDKLDSIGKLL